MITNVLAELTEKYEDASDEEKLRYIATAAIHQVVELVQLYELDVVREALRQWLIELEALNFLVNLNSRFKSRPIRYLGLIFALAFYGTEHVKNAIRIGENVFRK